MGKVKKSPGPQHKARIPPLVSSFVSTATGLPLSKLPAHLLTFPLAWPLPRGDLYHWIPLLDHFDEILTNISTHYKLNEGPQIVPFSNSCVKNDKGTSQEDDIPEEADKDVLEAICRFTTVLLDHCGNRTIYNSVELLDHLLNTTSLSLLATTLDTLQRLAGRFNVSWQKSHSMVRPPPHMLKQLYNIDMNKLFILGSQELSTDREKSKSRDTQLLLDSRVFALTLISFGLDHQFPTDEAPGPHLTFVKGTAPSNVVEDAENATRQATLQIAAKQDSPMTVAAGLLAMQGGATTAVGHSIQTEEEHSFTVPAIEIRDQSIEESLKKYLPKIPASDHYRFLHWLRLCKAARGTLADRQSYLLVYTLAIANLGLVNEDSKFIHRVTPPLVKHEGAEGLVDQLAMLMFPKSKEQLTLPQSLRVAATKALYSMLRMLKKPFAIINVVNYTSPRSEFNTMFQYLEQLVLQERPLDESSLDAEADRELIGHSLELWSAVIDKNTRERGSDLLPPGPALQSLMRLLESRAPNAKFIHWGVVIVLTNLYHHSNSNIAVFAPIDITTTLANLLFETVNGCLEQTKAGNGIPDEHKSSFVDFSAPFVEQQTIRAILKFIQSILTVQSEAGERFSRNMIDQPHVLKALHTLISNGDLFGSAIWSLVVNAISSFLNNDPASYVILVESGIRTAFFDAVKKGSYTRTWGSKTQMAKNQLSELAEICRADNKDTDAQLQAYCKKYVSSVQPGFMRSGDAILAASSLAAAICLNEAGLEQLLESSTIEGIFACFTSEPHLDILYPAAWELGSAMDEHIRHYPRVKDHILANMMVTLARVANLCTKELDEPANPVTDSTSDETRAAPDQPWDDPSLDDSEPSTLDGHDQPTALSEPLVPRTRSETIRQMISYVTTMLDGAFSSNPHQVSNLLDPFLQAGGLRLLLKIVLNPHTSLDGVHHSEYKECMGLIHKLMDHRLYVVFPTLMLQLDKELQTVESFVSFSHPQSFFHDLVFCGPDRAEVVRQRQQDLTRMPLKLMHIEMLMSAIRSGLTTSVVKLAERSTPFQSWNFADLILKLVHRVQDFHKACACELVFFHQLERAHKDELASQKDEAVKNTIDRYPSPTFLESEINRCLEAPASSAEKAEVRISPTVFSNLKTILSRVGSSTTSFYQLFAKLGVARKVKTEPYLRQLAFMVQNGIAKNLVSLFSYSRVEETTDELVKMLYLKSVIGHIGQVLQEVGKTSSGMYPALTLHLFEMAGGFQELNKRAETILEIACKPPSEDADEQKIRSRALDTLVSILHFFVSLSGRAVQGSYHNAQLNFSTRDRSNPLFFSAGQVVVNVRHEILPMVQKIWRSNLIDDPKFIGVPFVVNILRHLAEALYENGAFSKRLDILPVVEPFVYKPFVISSSKLAEVIQNAQVDKFLAYEALYRGQNSREHANNYIRAIRNGTLQRLAVPDYDFPVPAPIEASIPAPPAEIPSSDEASMAETTTSEDVAPTTTTPAELTVLDQVINEHARDTAMAIDEPAAGESSESPKVVAHPPIPTSSNHPISHERLGEMRDELFSGLVERVLEALAAHPLMSAAFADLIRDATSRGQKKENVAESETSTEVVRLDAMVTLTQALLSFKMEDDITPNIERIAGISNTLARLINDEKYAKGMFDEVFQNLEPLVDYVDMFQGETSSNSVPWEANILLLFEKFLSADAMPAASGWKPPVDLLNPGELTTPETKKHCDISFEFKQTLFDKLMEKVQLVGKDTTLAFAFLRVLTILTREPQLSAKLVEKQNLQRFFMMMRQLNGHFSGETLSAIMLVLRHLVENTESIRGFMETEILIYLQRQSGTSLQSFVRDLSRLAIRSPAVFEQATKNLVRMDHMEWSTKNPTVYLKDEHRQRVVNPLPPDPSTMPISEEAPKKENESEDKPESSSAAQFTEVQKDDSASKNVHLPDPDHLVHFMCAQLIAFKDVTDVAPAKESKEKTDTKTQPAEGAGANSATQTALTTTEAPSTAQESDQAKSDRHFSLQEHPAHIYRCFLLQILSELVMSYDRAKLELINFSRKHDARVGTPSKPKSTVLNYLFSLITHTHKFDAQNVAERKAVDMSEWAQGVIVALCMQNKEHYDVANENPYTKEDPDPELTTVRRFVIEQSIKHFKEVAQIDTLTTRYEKLAGFGRLFDKMLQNQVRTGFYTGSPAPYEHKHASRHTLAKLMYEKGMVQALTAAIADIEALKEESTKPFETLAKPLATLCAAVVFLSQHKDLQKGNGVVVQEEEQSGDMSDTSMSSLDETREETPDLFRNSSLGVIENRDAGGWNEEYSEDDEDAVMEDDEPYDDGYEEGYDDEMEYDYDMPDEDELVSDAEDEEEDDGGPGDLEGLPGDVGLSLEVDLEDEDEDGESGVHDSQSDMEEDESDEENDDDEHDEDDDEEDEEGDEDEEDDEEHESEMSDDEPIPTDQILEVVGRNDASAALQGHLDEEWDSETDELIVDGSGAHGAARPPRAGRRLGHRRQPLYIQRAIDDEEEDDEELEGHLEDDFTEEDEEEPMDDGYEDEYRHDDWGHPEHALNFYHHNLEELDAMAEDGMYPPHRASTMFRANRALGHRHRHLGAGEAGDLFANVFTDRHGRNPFDRRMFASERRGQTGLPVSVEDGTNPLLRQDSAADMGRHHRHHTHLTPGQTMLTTTLPRDLTSGVEGSFSALIDSTMRSTADGAVNPMNLLSNIMQRLDNLGATHPGQRIEIVLDQSHSHAHGQPFPSQNSYAQQFPTLGSSGLGHGGPFTDFIRDFLPLPTSLRWTAEAKVLFNKMDQDVAAQMTDRITRALLPAAIADAKKHKEHTDELAAKAEKARLEREKAEAELERLRAEKERADAEAAEAAAEAARLADQQAAEEAAAAAAQTAEQESSEPAENSDAMEGVQTSEPAAGEATEAHTTTPAEPSEPAAPQPRITATFRGSEVDITDLGIDLEYLNALPDEYREEVLTQALLDHRQRGPPETTTNAEASTSGAPAAYDPEFLDALPPDLREEILQQERLEQRRRDREAERRRQREERGEQGGAQGEEMDGASFLATLDPNFRNVVLMEQDEATLGLLGPGIAAEAQGLRLPNLNNIFGSRLARTSRTVPGAQVLVRPQDSKTKPTLQVLDKAGIAAILRFLFHKGPVNLHTPGGYILSILASALKNRQNVLDVMSVLTAMVVDSTQDSFTVDKTFQQLTSRAKPNLSTPKPPQGLRRTNTGSVMPAATGISPVQLTQNCLDLLNHLVPRHLTTSHYFYTEHEPFFGFRFKSSKKGKAKEDPSIRFAMNGLLSLLSRTAITDNQQCMQNLSQLLETITMHLGHMILKARERQEAEDKAAREKAEAKEKEAEPKESSGEQGQESTEGQSGDIPAIEGSGNTEANAGSTTVGDKDQTAEADKKESSTKPAKKFTPPIVPPENLRLVVNMITAKQCTSATFKEALAIIKNLCLLDGGYECMSDELVHQAKSLADPLMKELDVLYAAASKTSEAEFDPASQAIAPFAKQTSNQSKLLRVLHVLDYIYGTKHRNKESTDSKDTTPFLVQLYEDSAFAPLWTKLSDCLRVIRTKENNVAIATILLSLIESLMLVCKNTGSGEPLARSMMDISSGTPTGDIQPESLFFHFTEDNRKLLNELVRQNTRLMSGSFSLLVKNPKVLDFDNKRNYFSKRLHHRTDEARHGHTALSLNVNRNSVLTDSYRSLHFKSADEIKYGKLHIRFHHEEGVDAGGVTREWFQAIARQIFNPDNALFIPVAADRTTFHPSDKSWINPEHLKYFHFIGRLIGKALYDNRTLDCHFSRAVYKRMLGKTVSVKDMETLDLEYYKSLCWMLENDISEVITETFSTEKENFGVAEIIDLVPNGRNIPVTEENKQEYVQLMSEYRLTGCVSDQFTDLLKGFHDIIPSDLISIFNEQELELLISGLPDIDIEDWRANTDYVHYNATSPQIQWFWRAVRSFDNEERAKLLQFVTGTSKVPLAGFKELEGMNGFTNFSIHRAVGDRTRLPTTHTCFNQLDLPEYDDYDTLRRQLYTAMTVGGDYFGFA